MNSKVIKLAAALLIVVIVVFAIWEFGVKGQSTDKKSQTMTPSSTPMPSGASSATGNYKDGNYEAKGQYQNPDRVETIDVTLTLKDGKVTDVNFTGSADAASTTKFMQKNFADGYKDQVVGKPIDQVNLGVINGSSLTPKGFMDALNQIKTQAKA
ncbi:MAG TPA: hypothetical protein VHE53_00400 [Patescibacteria group bacterium]|nr:hypothetical protein [Patescibacteria group bacterium]